MAGIFTRTRYASSPPILLAIVVLATICTIGCTHDRLLKIDLNPRVTTPPKAAVLLFVDGLGQAQLDRHLAAGNCPNIDKYLIRRGTRIKYAFSTLPSITYANTTTFLTGLAPGHHGIVGNRWFDRYRLLYEDYAYIKTYRNADTELAVPTIYDLLAERFTTSIQCAVRRGVTHTIDNWATSGINWFFGWYTNVDKLTAMRFELISDIANRVGRWPGFVHAYFPALDETGHRFGLDCPRYAAAVRNVDAQIGRICDGLQQAGLLERTYLVLVSDHGFITTGTRRWIDPTAWLQGWHHLRVHEGLYLHDRYYDRAAYFAGIDAVVARDGCRKAAIYLCGPNGWHEPADPELLDRLVKPLPPNATDQDQPIWRLEGLALTAYHPQPNLVRIVNARGVATIRRTWPGPTALYSYMPEHGDPLGYMDDPAIAAFVRTGPHTSRQWLAATATTRIPDFVGQIVEMFDSPRAGDLVLFAQPGWDFSPQDLAGHGSIFADEMRVTMIFAGPGIPAGKSLDYARTTDIMPTLVELLGAGDRLKDIGRLDGNSLAGKLLVAPTAGTKP